MKKNACILVFVVFYLAGCEPNKIEIEPAGDDTTGSDINDDSSAAGDGDADGDGDGDGDVGDDDDNNNNDNDDNDDNDDNTDNDGNDTSGEADCIDMDGDWWCDPIDCDDENAHVHPGAEEIADNGIDDDCDGNVDELLDTDIPIGPIEMDCSDCPGEGGTLAQMLCAVDLCDDSVLVSNTYETGGENQVAFTECTPEDTYEAVSHFGDADNGLAPLLNGSYAMMATGPAQGTYHSTVCSGGIQNGTDTFPGDSNREMYDVVRWQLTLTAPEIANSFSFKYVFLSEEYDDYIGTYYNDKFYVILEAESTQDGEPSVINYTKCRDPEGYFDFECTEAISEDFGCETGEKYCYIAINSAFSECCWYDGCPDSDPAENTDLSGTGYTCAPDKPSDSNQTGSSTGWLQTAWPIKGGETFTLTFHLHDTSDGQFDSQVLLDQFQFSGGDDQGTIIVE